ncbi:MAG: hypothetical protein MI922_02980, partial [Bacteroidales bacterium]|nr:hypothetical protein [Bacteroidales bacterium]
MNKNKTSTDSESQLKRDKTDSGENHTSRRDFIKVLSYSTGAAALFGACQQPIRKVIPYVIQPESFTPGKSVYYATSFVNGRHFYSIKAKTQNARPIKLDGNDKCPINSGGSTAQLQASLLNEYDEDRIQFPQKLNKELSWDQIDSEIIKHLEDLVLANKKILLLADFNQSPSTNQLFEEFSKYYSNIDIIQYERNSYSALIEVHEEAFGKKIVPNYAFNNAKCIVSFHADFLGTYLSPIEYSKQYAQVKSPESDNLVKHIHLESEVTVTGSQADIRIPVDYKDEYRILQAIYQLLKNGTEVKFSDQNIRLILDQLIKNKENSVVLSSTNDYRIQLLVCLINQQLGNYGKTIFFDEQDNKWLASDAVLEEKLKQLKAGHYSGLITYHSNPVYDFKSFKLDSTIKKL